MSEAGVKPCESRIQSIKNLPSPETSAELRRFLGMIEFYRRFVPHFADLVCPLQDLITSYMRNRKQFRWNQTAEECFQQCKTALINCVTLQPVDPAAPCF